MIVRRPALVVFTAALALRLGVVLWAPGNPEADGIFYRIYAGHIAHGLGYVDVDGSPVVRWMPGWPLLLGALYALFGSHPRVALLANASLDAATAAVLVGLGTRLFGRRSGAAAGALYAVWPGMLFLCATHMSEPLFNLLLVGTLAAVSSACEADRRRELRFAAAGACLGAAALVKAEPLVMLPGVALALWRTRASTAGFWRSTAVLAGVAAAMLAPWTLRNYAAFDRFLPTAASGGIGVHLANHPGASGGQDLRANRALQARYRGANSAATSIARHDAGWGEAWSFVREHPAEELRIVANKLRLTYTSDARGAMLVRGMGAPARWHVSPTTWQWMRGVSEAWWFAMLALAIAGAPALRRARPVAAPLLIGAVLVPWLFLHVVFLGGPRYHVPQIPVLALLAGCGIARLRGPARAGRRAPFFEPRVSR